MTADSSLPQSDDEERVMPLSLIKGKQALIKVQSRVALKVHGKKSFDRHQGWEAAFLRQIEEKKLLIHIFSQAVTKDRMVIVP